MKAENFKHWKEALSFILISPGQEKITFPIENKRDIMFLKTAAMRYKILAGNDALSFSYPDDLSSFTYQFHTDERVEVPTYHKGLKEELWAIKEGETKSYKESEYKIEAVRSVAYNLGNFKVKRTEDGCQVTRVFNVGSVKPRVQELMVTPWKVGEFRELPCEPEMLSTIRVYVSQLKEKDQSLNVLLIGGNARITRTK